MRTPHGGVRVSYVALYRKYRPQTFAEVVAQDHVVRTLGNALTQNRLSHAYLLAGPRGTGKTSVARILAKAINCSNRAETGGAEPCNNCESCMAISEGHDLDVLEIDAASNRGIDEIRDLREKVRYAPARSPYKVYIVDEVHMLTNEAFNAFLKTLEDPPAHCVFVFATTDPQKLPATILSRCQRFDFHQVSPEEIMGRLRQICEWENCPVEEQALVLMARHARGGMRDALALLDQARSMAAGSPITAAMLLDILGVASEGALLELTGAAMAGDVAQGLNIIHRLVQGGRDTRQLLRDWVDYLRNLLIMGTVGPEAGRELVVVSPDLAEPMARQAAQLPASLLLRAITYLAERDQVMRWAPDGRLVLESAWLHFLTMLQAGGAVDGGSVSESPSDVAIKEPAPQRALQRPEKTAQPQEPARAATTAQPQDATGPDEQDRPKDSVHPAVEKAEPLQHISQVQERWDEICRLVQAQDRWAGTYLEQGTPVELQGSRLVVAYPTGIAGQRMAGSRQYRQLAAQVLREVFQVSLVVDVTISPGKEGKARPVADRPEPEEVKREGRAKGAAAAAEPSPAGAPASPGAPAGAGGLVPDNGTGQKGDAPKDGAAPRADAGGDNPIQEALRMFDARLLDPEPSLDPGAGLSIQEG